MKKRNKHIGSSLEDFLKEEGVLEETRAVALKETLAWQVQQAMEKGKISKVEMARRMNTAARRLIVFSNLTMPQRRCKPYRARHTLSAVICASSWFEQLTSPRTGGADYRAA